MLLKLFSSCSRPQIRPNTGFFKQLIKYEERLFGEASVKMVYCEAIDKEIPDVYEPDYIAMTWFRQRYGPIEQRWLGIEIVIPKFYN